MSFFIELLATDGTRMNKEEKNEEGLGRSVWGGGGIRRMIF
jgi:hypothetical protein